MSNGVIALLASIGAGGWIYSKMMRRTGGNTKSALTIAIVSGLGILLIFYTILRIIFKN